MKSFPTHPIRNAGNFTPKYATGRGAMSGIAREVADLAVAPGI